MDTLSHTAPFVCFPAGTAVSATIAVGPGPNLDFLGQSSAGDLYLNRDFASMGLVCGSLMEEVETVLKRLVAAHAREPDTRMLILYSEKSVAIRKPCTLMNLTARKPKVFISPRNLESASKPYALTGTATAPLTFQESAITTQHLLDFFTPPSKMQGRSKILNTVQLIISQLREPFDLQHFIEMIEKENWTEDGANFMALRQTILASLISSPRSKHPNATLSSNEDILVDLGDPVLSSTGLENILMDMCLHQFLANSSIRRSMIVLCNAHEYVSTGSPLSSSLESLATSRSDGPTSIVLFTTSPSSIPPGYLNSVDYLIYGHGRSAMLKSTLHEHFGLETPTQHRMPGRLIVWSPESQNCENGNTGDLTEGTNVWKDSQTLIDVSELKRTMPKKSEEPETIWKHGAGLEIFGAEIDPPVRRLLNTGPAGDVCSLSSSLDSEEEGMIPLSSIRREGGRMSGLNLEVDAGQTPSVDTAATLLMSPVSIADSLPPTKGTRQTSTTARDPSAYRPLISAVLRVSNNQPDALVSFEAVRSILGNNAAIKDLGWWTYTTLVEDARQQGVIEVIETSGGFKFVRLSASSLTQAIACAKTLPAVKVEPVMTSPLITSTPSKQALTTSKVDYIIRPASWLTFLCQFRYSPHLPQIAVAATELTFTTHDGIPPEILENCPDKHLPLIKAILRLGANDVQAKVSFDAVGSAVGKTKAEVRSRGHGWVSYPHWAQKAQEDGWILQGGFGGMRWIALGPKLRPKPSAVASAHSAPTIGINQSPAGSSSSREAKNLTPEPVAGPSALPPSTLIPSNLDQIIAAETMPSHSSGVDQSNLEVRNPSERISSATVATIKAAASPQSPAAFASNATSPSTYLPPLPTFGFNHPHVTTSVGTRGANQDIDPETGGDALITRLISVQSRRVTADSYPSSHRLVVDTMISLGSGSSYTQVGWEDLWSALRSRAHRETEAKLISCVKAAEVSGVLKKFANDQGNAWVLLENPVQQSASNGGVTAWVHSFMPQWF